MGKRLQNWLEKTPNKQTKALNRRRWGRFATWVVTTKNPLTGKPYFSCQLEHVDDQIRSDFEDMKTALFLDKYRDILTKYCASLSHHKNNTINSYMGSIKAFFASETINITLSQGTLPSLELATGEHEFTKEELQAMREVGTWEDKARVSTALLGWGVGDFLNLTVKDIQHLLTLVDPDGFVTFLTDRIKTRRHSVKAVGILIPEAVADLEKYLSTIDSSQKELWTTKTPHGMNLWLRSLAHKAGIQPRGRIRFHCVRKFMFTIAEFNVDTKFAKIIIGKKVRYADLTYSTGLKQRVLQQYKKRIYPHVSLTTILQPHQDLQAQLDHQSQEIKDLKTSLHTLQELNVAHKQQLHDFQEKMMVLLSSEITFQKLDLFNLKDLTQHQPRKESALKTYLMHLEANLEELEQMQRQLLQDPDLKKIYHRQLTQQISDKDYHNIMKELKNTQFIRD
jgi:hypothetical protein